MADKLIFKKMQRAVIYVRMALPIKHLKAVTKNWQKWQKITAASGVDTVLKLILLRYNIKQYSNNLCNYNTLYRAILH